MYLYFLSLFFNNNIDFICLYLEISKRQQIQGLQHPDKDKKKKRQRQKYRKRQTERKEEREAGNGRYGQKDLKPAKDAHDNGTKRKRRKDRRTGQKYLEKRAKRLCERHLLFARSVSKCVRRVSIFVLLNGKFVRNLPDMKDRLTVYRKSPVRSSLKRCEYAVHYVHSHMRIHMYRQKSLWEQHPGGFYFSRPHEASARLTCPRMFRTGGSRNKSTIVRFLSGSPLEKHAG